MPFKDYFSLNKTNIMVEFRINGHNFDPSYITSRLLIEPDELWIEGDIIKKRNIRRKYTCWAISTGYQESTDINLQLSEIINRLDDKRDILIEIKNIFDLIYRIDIIINIENEIKPNIVINKKAVEFANYIKAEYDFDVYIYS